MDGVAIDSRPVVVELEAVAEVALHASYAQSVRRRKPPWYSYDARHDRGARRGPRARGSPTDAASASGLASSASMPRDAVRAERERLRPVRAGAADGAAGRAASSRRASRRPPRTRRSSSGAAGSPRARAASAGTRARAGSSVGRSAACGVVVEHVEEARERGEGALVPLLLGEEPQHRLRADQARRSAGSSRRAPRLVRPDELARR